MTDTTKDTFKIVAEGAQEIIDDKFVYQQSGRSTTLFAFIIDGETTGYAAVEKVGQLGVLHLSLNEDFKRRHILNRMIDVYKNQVKAHLREAGFTMITSNCPATHLGITRVMKQIGMTVTQLNVGVQPLF